MALKPWRKPRVVHDPGRILLDLALAVALGGYCLADVAMLRAEPGVFGPVASDPTASRLVDKLAAAGPRALGAIRRARAEVRQRVRTLAGDAAPNAGVEVVVDVGGVLVLAHSEKQDAAATSRTPADQRQRRTPTSLPTTGQWNPAPTRRDGRAAATPAIIPNGRNGPPGQTNGPSRKIEVR